jgi:PST family polysaccharide transporter
MTERPQALPPKPSSRRIAFGASAAGAVSLVKMLLQVLALPVMARLLGPSEFGLYALAFPVVAFVGLLADGGLGISLVKEPDSSAIWSTAFWALLGLGIILAAGLAGAGFVMGAALGQPRLPGIMAVLSLTIVMMAVTVPPVARLERQGRIAVGAFADLVGNVLGVGIGIWMATRGAGSWSLVGQFVTLYLVRACVLNAVAFKMPALEFHPSRLLSHFATGGLFAGTRIADFVGRAIENSFLTRGFGTATVGLFVFSNQVPRFISEAVSNPLWLSLYIRAVGEERAIAAALHRQLSRLLCMILFPAAAFFLVVAPVILPALLGPKWGHAIPLIRVLFPAYVLNVLGALCGAVRLACNRYQTQFLSLVGVSIGRILVVSLGPWIGLTGVAYGVVGINAVYVTIALVGTVAILDTTAWPLIRGLMGPLAASCVSGAATWMTLHYGGDTILIWVLCPIVAMIVYGLAILLFDRKHVTSDIAILKAMLKSPQAASATT